MANKKNIKWQFMLLNKLLKLSGDFSHSFRLTFLVRDMGLVVAIRVTAGLISKD
jgi:hypothetical protein